MITKNERTNDERRKNTQKRQLPFCKILECVCVCNKQTTKNTLIQITK